MRVAAIDLESLPKALIVLTAANNMAQANSGHMLVFQPTAISNEAAAEPPKVPLGSMVMYTTQIMAGEGPLVTKLNAPTAHCAFHFSCRLLRQTYSCMLNHLPVGRARDCGGMPAAPSKRTHFAVVIQGRCCIRFTALAGEVMTFNTLRVTTSTDPKALSKAIIARLAINSHTVMECYGTQALAVAVLVGRAAGNEAGQQAACMQLSSKACWTHGRPSCSSIGN